MGPNFDKKTKDTLAKRAAYECSNPSCTSLTIGPNTKPDKTSSNGEAAHIYGARPTSARYKPDMTDATRSEITNGIWLCRNCHKLIDDDGELYPAKLLFRWREQHEQRIAERQNGGVSLLNKNLSDELRNFSDYPPIIRRILIDRPPGWEWRLTAEILRYLNASEFRRLSDLRDHLYTAQIEHVPDIDVLDWFSDRCHESTVLIEPFTNLFARLNLAWGRPGEPGDAREIDHICKLLHNACVKMIDIEERIRFVRVSEQAQPLVKLLEDINGSQVEHIRSIPSKLDEVIGRLAELEEEASRDPVVISHTIEFSLPKNWSKSVIREKKRFARSALNMDYKGTDSGGGCLTSGVVIIVFILIAATLFG